MDSKSKLLRQIPKVDDLLRHPALLSISGGAPPQVATEAVRCVLGELREAIIQNDAANVPDANELAEAAAQRVLTAGRPGLRRVINGTGVILHTNLGRAPLAKAALSAISDAARGYSTLEYDTCSGGRGSRHSHVEALLCRLTGARAAMAVNNNAAAVLLVLSTLAAGREVVVSRGELVEIGGSFRVPDVMNQSGCRLVEVGTTNKTSIADYERAICPDNTGALMKVHTSNFKIVGFTHSVTLSDLVALGERYNLPVIEDLGSGCLLPLSLSAAAGEPVVSDSISAGADVVCFSGDKLLGGPQAGIIVGSKDLIEKMKRHPLARALRMDKLTLAALEATLRIYLNPDEAVSKIPVLSMLTADCETLHSKAVRLHDMLSCLAGGTADVVREDSEVGGGSLPGVTLPTAVLAISPAAVSAGELQRQLRESDPPIIGRVSKDRLLLDVRTIDEQDFSYIAGRIVLALGHGGGKA